MATTTNYAFNKPTVGGNESTWGGLLNDNWDALDVLLGGITATEFSYIDGLTANVQTQLDAKAPSASPTFTGTVNAGDKIVLGSWEIRDSGTVLYFAYGGNDVFKIDSSGNITAEANITAYGTV